MRDQFIKYSRISNNNGREYKYSANLTFLKELSAPERKKEEVTSPKHDVKNHNEWIQDTSEYESEHIEVAIDEKWTDVEISLIRSTQTKKCGEILVDIDEHTFILNCFLCGDVCFDLDEFMCHIKVQHEKFLSLEKDTENEVHDDNAFLEQASVNSNDYVAGEGDDDDEGKWDDGKDNDCEDDEGKWDDGKDNDCEDNGGDEYIPQSPTESTKHFDADVVEPKEIDLGVSNEVFVTQLIDLLKQHAVLWNNSNSFQNSFRTRKRKVIYILNDLIARYPDTPLTYKTLSNALARIRQAYRYDRRRMDLSKDKSAYKPKHWFFSKLQFLSNICSTNDQGAKPLEVYQNNVLPLPYLTNEQHLQLFQIYKSFPCLWDVQHIGFRFKNQRQEALDEMLEAVKTKLNLNLTSDDLKSKIHRIHYAFTQQKQQKLQCEFVEEEFIPTCKYYENLAFLSDNVGPFKCPFCEETFNTVDTYRVHKSKHDGSLPFSCPICNRGFVNVGNCNVHVRRHTRNFNFECKYCKRGFPTSSEMNVHIRIHTGERPYFCELCGQSFRTWTFFDCHMRRHQKRRSHKCTICSKGFYENHKLKDHMKTHLNIRDKVCNVCDKAFTCSKYLRQHKQIHAEKKKYICKICSKDFAQLAGLSGHMKSHGTTST